MSSTGNEIKLLLTVHTLKQLPHKSHLIQSIRKAGKHFVKQSPKNLSGIEVNYCAKIHKLHENDIYIRQKVSIQHSSKIPEIVTDKERKRLIGNISNARRTVMFREVLQGTTAML